MSGRDWRRVSLGVVPGVLAFALMAFLRAPTEASRPGLVFEATFDGGMTPSGGSWSQEGNRTTRVVEVDGEVALRVELNRLTDLNPSRTELVPRGMDSTWFDNGGLDARIGETNWYGLRTLLPAEFKDDGTPEIITQFHDYPDEAQGEDWRSPAVDLTLEPRGDGTQHFMVSVRSDTKPITPAGGGDRTPGKYSAFDTYDLGRAGPSAGRWTEWIWKITWGYDERGSLKLYRDGALVLDLPNRGNCFNDRLGPYMKIGIYKWEWAKAAETGTSTRVIHYDDVRIAAGPSATYDSVAPARRDADRVFLKTTGPPE